MIDSDCSFLEGALGLQPLERGAFTRSPEFAPRVRATYLGRRSCAGWNLGLPLGLILLRAPKQRVESAGHDALADILTLGLKIERHPDARGFERDLPAPAAQRQGAAPGSGPVRTREHLPVLLRPAESALVTPPAVTTSGHLRSSKTASAEAN